MKKTKAQMYWENLATGAFRFLWFTLHELFDGIAKDKIDVVRYLYPGTFAAAFFVLRLDSMIARLPGLE